jgi:hypothetical protein
MTASRTLTRRPSHLRNVSLREGAVRCSRPLEVDHDAGVIRGVKVLGAKSSNGRRYTPDAISRASDFYEGISVNVDHPEKKPTQPRSSYDRFGWLENVRLEEGELYADLCVLKTHPMARRVMEAAERNPRLFGLSHNAQGNGRTEGGVFVVEEITEVRHVDLVADPATTQSLCESKMANKKKPAKPVQLSEMMEDDALMDAPVVADDAGGDHTDDLFAAFKKLMGSDPEKANKILAMLKAEMDAEPDSEPVAEEDEPAEETEADVEEAEDEEDDDMKESRQAKPGKGTALLELRTLRLEKKCRALCEQHGVTAAEDLVESLAAMGSEEKAKKHIVWLKANVVGKKTGQKPRSQAPGQDLTEGRTEHGAPRVPKDIVEQLNWLRN